MSAFPFVFESTSQVLDGDDDDDEEWNGIGSSQAVNRQHDEEYENEETVATVTVVEDFDPDTIIHGPAKSENASERSLSLSESALAVQLPKKAPVQSAKKKKVKEKKIRYQTKDARKKEQLKQRARRTEKAERAGGKASRKMNRGHGSKRR